jgi:uroporphyrinogen III methyltransferase/synthase
MAKAMAQIKKTKVYLVGAGPGSADLITLRGAELIRQADCIIHDRLVNPLLLQFAKSDAEIILTPKRAGPDSVTQQQINELLLQKAAQGKTIVRLKGGDPVIFGRGSEEAKVLADAGIEFEIVPGVTAATAAAEYAGIMLTDRTYSSQVAFITGREAEGKIDTGIDWELLAKFEGTLVFYMGIGNLPLICEKLMKNGLSPKTPAAVIENATLPNQRKVTASIAEMPFECEKQKIKPPAIIIIGTAAKIDNRLDWFSRLPLFDKTIVITRDSRGNAEFAAKIIAAGGNPVKFDAIKTRPLTDKNEFLTTLTKINRYEWIIFTSRNAVEIFFECIKKLGKDARIFSSAKLAVIGPKTKEALEDFGITADFVPTIFTSAQLGKRLIAAANLKNKKVLLLRSAQADDELKQILTDAGADVDQTSIYSVEKQKCDCSQIDELLEQERIDWLTFASPSAAESFFEQVDPDNVKKAKIKIASIGPVTTQRLKSLGVAVDAEAAEHTIDGLLAAVMS